ncbi:MAG TPA: SIMPL domain-containing protein [Bacteroidia bacterium]|jgi:uncharacterized protein YggE|nr:SIMPL domain-containing protein [Bacteroidia bacterium]
MIKRLLILFLTISGIQHCMAQAAGNSIYAAPAASTESMTDYSYKSSESRRYSQPPPVYYPSAGDANAVVINDSVIEMGMKSLMNVKADSYVAIFGVSQVAETIDSCNRLMNERISGFVSRLVALGIDKNDIYVDFVSQVPVFEYEVEKKLFSKKYNEIPKGFELKKNVHVAYKKNDGLDEMLMAAAKNEIYDLVKVDYIINNVQAVYDTLRSQSVRALNRKMEDMKKLGIHLNAKFEVVAEDEKCFYPIDRYRSYTAFNNVSLPAIKKTATSAGYQSPKTLSLYYDKLPYGNYEIVINPRVVEPNAQFTYNLRLRYTFKTEIKEKGGMTPIINK